MPTGDFPPPEGMIWTDAFGYVPAPHMTGYTNLDAPCTHCGAPLGQHFIGGPIYHPVDRPSLWFWGN